jgi:integrase
VGHIRDRWGDPTRAGRNPNSRYQVKYRVDGREKQGGSFRTLAEARRKLIELEASVHRGQWIDPNDRTLVAEECRAYAATRPYGRSTAERVDGYVRNHIDPTGLGARRLSSVRPSDVQVWVTERSTMMAPSTLRALVKFVRSVFAAAVLDNRIPRSPFVRITLPRHEQERIVPLTVDQVRALAAAMLPKYRAMVITQAGLGVRIGELLALRVEDVSFLRRSARVEHQIDAHTRERVPPKTPRSRRTIPLPDVVSAALAEHLQLQPAAPDGLLFHTRAGLPYWHEYYTQKVFAPAVAKAKLPPGTSSHDLRHHYASTLLAAGESVIAVAERLGHENATLVLTTYGHLVQGAEDRTRKAVDGAWNVRSDASEVAATAQGRPG